MTRLSAYLHTQSSLSWGPVNCVTESWWDSRLYEMGATFLAYPEGCHSLLDNSHYLYMEPEMVEKLVRELGLLTEEEWTFLNLRQLVNR